MLSSVHKSEMMKSPEIRLESEPCRIELDLTECKASDSLLLSAKFSDQQPGSMSRPTHEEEKKEADGWSKYTVVSILGEGSYGKVYKVTRNITAEEQKSTLFGV